MPADFDPSDRTQPLQAPADLTRFGWAPGNYTCVRCDDCGRVFEGAKRCVRCRPCAEKMAAGCAIGNQQSDEGFQRVDGGRLSADEIAQMRARWARVVGDVPVGALDKSERGERLGHLIGSDMYRLLDAVEALTAENARLTSALAAIGEAFGCHPECSPQGVADLVIKRAAELQAGAFAEVCAERDRLKANMATARALVDRAAVRAWNDYRQTEAMSPDRLRLTETHGLFRQALDLLNPNAAETEADMQELADLGQAMQPELYAGAKEDVQCARS